MCDKITRRLMLCFAGVFFSIGVLGMVDGIRSVLAGGYADNIVLGAIIAFCFPLPYLGYYWFIKEIEQNRNRRNIRR